MSEIISWKRIVYNGIDTPYIISTSGIIMNDTTGRFMKYTPDKDGYPVVKLSIGGCNTVYKVHRLVALTFISNTNNKSEVNHMNRNHWDASVDNLEWVTGQENIDHLVKSREKLKYNTCNISNGSKHYSNKYTDIQITQVCIRLEKNEPVSDISRKTLVDKRTIYLIRSGKIWKHISCHFNIQKTVIISTEMVPIIKKLIDLDYGYDIICTILQVPYTSVYVAEINNIINHKIEEKGSTTRES